MPDEARVIAKRLVAMADLLDGGALVDAAVTRGFMDNLPPDLPVLTRRDGEGDDAPSAGTALLRRWLDEKRGRAVELAAAAGTFPSRVTAWRKGDRPRARTRALIERATNGAVPASAWEGR